MADRNVATNMQKGFVKVK